MQFPSASTSLMYRSCAASFLLNQTKYFLIFIQQLYSSSCSSIQSNPLFNITKMNEIEFEDSSITVMTQRTQGHLLTGKDQVRSKANSGYEVHRESLRRSALKSIPSTIGYGSISELKQILPTLPLDQKLKLLLRVVQEGEGPDAQLVIENLVSEKPCLRVQLDAKGQTLLHIASFKNLPKLVSQLIDYESKICSCSQKEILAWLNQPNQDSFTAIHFAAFVGSVHTMDVLRKHGADLNCKNQQGQNSLAIAAQGDQVLAMVWLQIQGLSFTEKDEKGGTPLHWATYYGSEFAVQFLLSWVSQLKDCKRIINQRDMEGMTALHLAAMTGNARIAKKLVLKGADKRIKDNKGATPAQEAKAGEYEHIYQMLENSNCLYDFLNIKQSVKPVGTSWVQVVAFFFMYFYCMCGTILFVYPFLGCQDIWLQGLSILSFLVGLLFYFLTWCTSPGFVATNSDKQLLFDLLNQKEPWELCADCQILKPKRSRHCEYCRRCVVVYDHHCPWINNCIGANNHAVFICFILSVLFNLIHILAVNVIFIKENFNSLDGSCSHYPWFSQVQNTVLLQNIKYGVSGSIMLICLVFLLPLSYLVYVQFNNLYSNKTSFEKYKQQGKQNKKKDSQLSSSSTSVSEKPRSKYSCANCMAMCCRNKHNQLYLG